VVVRVLALFWVLIFFVLGFAAIADTLFGTGPLQQRLNNFLPRLAVAAVWPLALFTPRGRYLLWRRWRSTP
jgi:hypothetical protein